VRQDGAVTARTDDARRPDRSMSLLVDMMSNTQDQAYADAAQRKAGLAGAPGTPGGRKRTASARSRVTAAFLLVALGLVTGMAAAQVKRRQADQGGVRTQLVADVQRRTAATDALAEQTARRREEVAQLQDAGLADVATGTQLRRQLAALELAAGTGAVTGPGVVVRLDDAEDAADPGAGAPSGDQAVADNPSRVLDRDLQDAVNGLWAAGAEAISVNDLRLTAQTAIRSAGEAILVDFRPLSPPYVIRAIGNPKVLLPSFVDGAAGRRLTTYTTLYGLRLAVSRTDEQVLPGSGSVKLRFSRADLVAS